MDSVNVKWDGRMSFTSEIDGHKITIDAKEESGGENKGPRPKPLILASLGGCTGIDVASMLTKMRVPFDSFNVKVNGKLTEEHPKHYYEITVTYEITGQNMNLENIRKAITLSEEKYCGVTHMLRQTLKLNNVISINGEVI